MHAQVKSARMVNPAAQAPAIVAGNDVARSRGPLRPLGHAGRRRRNRSAGAGDTSLASCFRRHASTLPAPAAGPRPARLVLVTGEPWAEGRDGSAPTYAERLLPRWWLWLIPPLLACVLAVAYATAYGALVGWVIEVAVTAVLWAAIVALSPVIRVDDRVFRAGRARLPLTVTGEIVALDGPSMVAQRRHGDGRAFVVMRTWAAPGGVSVQVQDPRDPHPSWLVTSRRPQALAQALQEARTFVADGGTAE